MLVHQHTLASAQVLTEGLEGYSVSEHERLEQREELQQHGRHRVEGLVQQAADTALSRMKDRSAVPLPATPDQSCIRSELCEESEYIRLSSAHHNGFAKLANLPC